MNSRSAELIDAIKRAAGTHNRDDVSKVLCTVKSVDMDSRTCTVTPVSGDAITEISDVKLMTNVDDGMLLKPAIKSEVIVTIVKKQMDFLCYVSMFSELDDVYTVANNLIQFNKGLNKGMAKVKELTEKFNNLENKVNDIITAYTAHTHTVPGVTSGVFAATSIPPIGDVITPLVPTQQTEIENTKVTH